jgi:adenine deaminase
MQKIAIAKRLSKPVDGHAPALGGEGLKKYIAAGITTDHECFKLEEALEKIKNGMKIQIREGSAACNFEALHSLISSHRDSVMLCSDDKHPDSLLDGHLNSLVKRALLKGHNLFDCIIAASKNTIQHYGLPVGMLRPGDSADFIEIDSPENFLVLQTVIKGKTVYNKGDVNFESPKAQSINQFQNYKVNHDDIKVPFNGEHNIPVIQAIDGQLITTKGLVSPKVVNDEIVSDVSRDILKIVVINRYHQAKPAVSFIQNFGLKKGAMASTVAHDSHNLIAVGTNDEDLLQVIELVQNSKGGLAATANGIDELLPLDVAGLMSTLSASEVTDRYSRLDQFVKHDLGSSLRAPFMTLSFMALLVIPSIKLSDKGLFDGDSFCFM